MASKKYKNPLGKSLKAILSENNTAEKNAIEQIGLQETNSFNNQETNESKENKFKIEYPFDLNEIGSILKSEREKKGLTISEISNIMNVRRHTIEAIENGMWERLPHEIYLKGYLKEYAAILGIQKTILPYLIINNINKTELSIPKDHKRNQRNSIRFLSDKSRFLSRTIFIYSLVVFILIAGLVLFNSKQEKADNIRLENAIQFSNSIDNTEQNQNTTFIAPNKKLLISCHERTWVSIIIDENEKKEFMLNPGEVVILNAKERFDILVGNAGGIKFVLNGKDVDFYGISGQVKKITL